MTVPKPPKRFDLNTENCSIARTLHLVGEKWTLLVLREAFLGLRRYEEYASALGCPRAVLTARLRTLVDAGLLTLTPYQEPGSRTRHEYRLTPQGLDLFSVLFALQRWGDRWLADEAGPPVVMAHQNCGESVSLAISCAAGHGDLTVVDLYPRHGPGALPPCAAADGRSFSPG